MAAMTATQQAAHILLVDDEPTIIESMRRAFQTLRPEYTLSIANGGRAAIELLKEAPAPYQLVLLDITMPQLSGLDVLAWMRQQPHLAQLRVVMLTALDQPDNVVQALEQGANDYVRKPVEPRELLARMDTHLETIWLEGQLRQQQAQLVTLNQVSHRLAQSLDLVALYSVAAEGALALLGASHSAVYQLRPSTMELICQELVSAETGRLSTATQPPISLRDGFLAKAFRRGKPLWANAPFEPADFRPNIDGPQNADVRALLASPFQVHGGLPSQSIGVLVVYKEQADRFCTEDVALMQSLTNALNSAIDNAWYYERVRSGKATLQALIDGILHPIYTVDANWQVQFANEERVASQHADGAERCYELFFGRTSPCQHCKVADIWRHEQPQQWGHAHQKADMQQQIWSISAYPLPQSNGDPRRAVVVWQDRTEERLLEQSLIQASKLSAVGQLAAGVAHEINNPLTVISTGAGMLNTAQLAPEDAEIVEWITAASERARRITQGLLDYSRESQAQYVAGDLNQSLQKSVDMLAYQMVKANVQVELALAESLPPLEADWEQLQSVWVNLLLNARDAVMIRPKMARNIVVSSALLPQPSRLQVSVQDNGSGINEAQQERIFDPFFTTKAPGSGTGLGLSIAQRIIALHHGDIVVTSRSNIGTTFRIQLPLEQ